MKSQFYQLMSANTRVLSRGTAYSDVEHIAFAHPPGAGRLAKEWAIRASTRVKALRFIMIAVLAGVLSLEANASAAPSEAEVRAAMILNFAQFIEWPSGAFESANTPLVIGVVDDDSQRQALTQLSASKTIAGRKVEVKHISSTEGIDQVHVLCMPSNRDVDFTRFQQRLAGKPVLSIGSAGSFTDAGGVIGFYTDQGKLRFEINTAAAERAGLKISSKLLKLARIVRH